MRLVHRWASDGEPPPRPFRRPLLWIALAVALSTTAALCSYDRFHTSNVSAAEARKAIANHSANAAAVVTLAREIRADLDALEGLTRDPGEMGDQARAALTVVREAVSK